MEASSENNTNNTMTKQEIYDKVCKHLAKQKTRAGDDISCQYRDDAGKKCAVGCLIPYHVWKKEVDANGLNAGSDVSDLCAGSGWAKRNLGRHEELLMELQGAHDQGYTNDEWLRERMIQIAKQFRIKPGAEQAIKTWNP